ncbi:MAG: hypothetical protein PHI27_06235 [Eubacteriales bacterium]|nr:hypothetical protein [Eubacteriales bacterium]MDD3881832.1 hypothetical protein [Eubacteriales bacterium]MDD4512922.1 hypothetical protein [Eubacteriales bacterium]
MIIYLVVCAILYAAAAFWCGLRRGKCGNKPTTLSAILALLLPALFSGLSAWLGGLLLTVLSPAAAIVLSIVLFVAIALLLFIRSIAVSRDERAACPASPIPMPPLMSLFLALSLAAGTIFPSAALGLLALDLWITALAFAAAALLGSLLGALFGLSGTKRLSPVLLWLPAIGFIAIAIALTASSLA